MLTLDGDWSNTGQIIDTGATLNLAGTFTTAALDTIVDHGGVLNIVGQLNNTSTLSVGRGAAFATLGVSGTTSGGVIKDTHASVAINGGTLSGVTYRGTLALGAANACSITGGLTLSAATGSGPGAIAVDGGTLYLLDNETLNHAVIKLGVGRSFGVIKFEGTGASQTLTLGTSLNLVQGGYLGWLINGRSGNETLINKGTITAGTAGGLFNIDGGDTTFANSVSVTVSNGDSMTIGGIQTGTASITNEGSISVTGSNSIPALGSIFGNTHFSASTGGSIGVCAGGTVIETGTALTIEGGALIGVTSEGTLGVGPDVTLIDTGIQRGRWKTPARFKSQAAI